MRGSYQQRLRGEAWHHSDFLVYVVQEIIKEKLVLTEGMALDLMFVLLFASFHTTSLALTLAVKLLANHPRVLDELTVEHERILDPREEFTPQGQGAAGGAVLLEAAICSRRRPAGGADLLKAQASGGVLLEEPICSRRGFQAAATSDDLQGRSCVEVRPAMN